MRLSGRPLYHLHRRGVKKKELTTHRPIVLAQRIQVKMLQIWRRAESGHSPEPVSHPVRDSLPSASRCPIPSSRATPAPLQGDVRPFMTYVPFSTSDLYNGKLQNPSFSEKPQALISLLETLFVTQQPTWDDCQQLLQVLFTTEERDKIRREARKLVMGPNGQPTEDPAGFKEVFPSSHPENWDPNAPHECLSATREPLSLLQKLGYRVSARKAQICRTAVTYLSYNLKKRLDPVASGWPPRVRQIAATALLVEDADKLTLRQALSVTGPHEVEALLRAPPERRLSNARITQYQALLLDQT
ncbi:uncharacterized protein LOC102968023 isoform X2 [Panthera tigris]|uniref:uncharacterized protein LOC102968023 isoform X2 n=1 Tax=Panthera tigris TaxID=9694 RepID=UPI001C6F76DF|nr:uncharacterized protein LOC102968023 isoform X2 [Panthera tigris]